MNKIILQHQPQPVFTFRSIQMPAFMTIFIHDHMDVIQRVLKLIIIAQLNLIAMLLVN